MTVWLCFCGVVGLLWALRHRTISEALRENRPLTPESYPPIGAGAPKVSVLVAAKDEERNIETCLRTMLDQDYPDYEIIVINDRSTDRTAEIIDKLAGENPERLRAMHIKHLEDGWFGKNHAMDAGVKQATGQWLCFIDADCRQLSRMTLAASVQEAERENVDFLSVLPVLETRSFWERVIQPVCAAIMVIWFNPKKVNNPRTKTAYANGAFMLISHKTYEAIGGHRAVRGLLNEDMHLARLAKRFGHRLFVVENHGLYLTRMYSSFRDAWRGWTRIFYGSFETFRRLAATLALVLIASIFPFVSLAVSIVGYVLADGESKSQWKIALLVTCTVVILLESVIYRFMKIARAASWAWATYCIGAVLGAGMVLTAIWQRFGGKTTWRGTTYASHTLVENEGRQD